MTRAAALLLALVAGPALAGDSVPGDMLWPEEPTYHVWIEAEVQDEAWWLARGVTQDQLLWSVFDGGSPDLPPDPAPVPLPFSGLLLAAALGLLWKWIRI